MVEKQYSSAREQYEIFSEQIEDLKGSLTSFIAEFILTLPIGISYETWVYLHQIKGDYK